MHRPALVRVPQFGLNLALGTELTSEAVVASLRVTPKVLVECGFEFENPDTSSIVHEALMN
jgi:NAD dependent epimerase/dehydratase family enzyme